jgi:hypothetical protein
MGKTNPTLRGDLHDVSVHSKGTVSIHLGIQNEMTGVSKGRADEVRTQDQAQTSCRPLKVMRRVFYYRLSGYSCYIRTLPRIEASSSTVMKLGM